MRGPKRPRSPKGFMLTSLRRRSRTVRQYTVYATVAANWIWTIRQLAAFAGKGCPSPQPLWI